MKHLKKLAGCLLALVMILTMSNVAVVNAANNTEIGYDTSGSITIDDAVSGQVYRIYMLIKLIHSGKLGYQARITIFLLIRDM